MGERKALKSGSTIKMPNLGQYIICEKIAEGGLSLVYTAKTKANNYPVVIKEFFPSEHASRAPKTIRDNDGAVLFQKGQVCPDDGYSDRFYQCLKAFEQEGVLGSSARSSNFQIVSFSDCGNGYAVLPRWSADSCSFFDLVSGWREAPPESVDLNFPDFGRLSFALSAINSLLSAVASIHDQGMLHLDITSTNVIWGGNRQSTPENGTAFLSDFGCAVLMSAGTYPAEYALSYSKDYAAPEYMIQDAYLERATDIYSVGRLLAFLCFGQRAFFKHTHLQELVERMRISDICKKGLLTILQKATAHEMHERYQFAREMQIAIRELRSYIPLQLKANPDNVVFANGFELLQKMSACEVSTCLVANDNALYSPEIQKTHGGSVALWSQHIEANPGCWGFILETGTLNIVANWSFCFVNEETEEIIRTGHFEEGSFSLSKRDDIFSTRATSIYLLNISANISHRSEKTRRLLWNTLAKRVFELSKDSLIKGIWTTVLREDQKQMFQEMGFRYVTSCSSGGDVYYLNLTSENKSRFTREYPIHEAKDLLYARIMDDAQICRFSREAPPTQIQLEQVAELLWLTDPYIYPALMTLEAAKQVLPTLFWSSRDAMFNFNNLRVAMVNDEVVGVALYCTGPLCWKSDYLKQTASIMGINLSDSFDLAESQYFESYNNVNSSTTSLINLCVSSKWKGMGIGKKIMDAFITEHTGDIELYVLKESVPAIQLYLRCGYELVEALDGFSLYEQKPACYKMKKLSAAT